jgi:hypothetical protein
MGSVEVMTRAPGVPISRPTATLKAGKQVSNPKTFMPGSLHAVSDRSPV